MLRKHVSSQTISGTAPAYILASKTAVPRAGLHHSFGWRLWNGHRRGIEKQAGIIRSRSNADSGNNTLQLKASHRGTRNEHPVHTSVY
jgi:hypothetical protein